MYIVVEDVQDIESVTEKLGKTQKKNQKIFLFSLFYLWNKIELVLPLFILIVTNIIFQDFCKLYDKRQMKVK